MNIVSPRQGSGDLSDLSIHLCRMNISAPHVSQRSCKVYLKKANETTRNILESRRGIRFRGVRDTVCSRVDRGCGFLDTLNRVVSLGCCSLYSLMRILTFSTLLELGRGRLSQDLVAECVEASQRDSVGAGWYGVLAVRAEAIKAFFTSSLSFLACSETFKREVLPF